MEVLITLALTSLAVTLSYTTLTYVQKLLANHQQQNKVIGEFAELKQRLALEVLQSSYIAEGSENYFTIKKDTATTVFQILDKSFIFIKAGRCDTFHLAAENIQKGYELIKNPLWKDKLLKTLTFETELSKQRFDFGLNKSYEASIKLILEKGD